MATAPIAKAPTPDLLAVDMTNLLSGKTVFTTELWQQFLATMAGAGVTLVIVLVLTYLSLRFYLGAIDNVFRVINANIRPDAALRMTQRSNTLSGILRSLGKVLILFMAGMIVLSKLGVNVAPILASAGIVGVAVGFGAQSLVKDIISGFFILVEDQYGVGDVIEVSGQTGTVEHMNLRITQLRNQDGNLITVPNGEIKTVVNQSKEWACAVLEVSVPYQSDPDHVIAILKAVGDELALEMPDQILGDVEVLGMETFKATEAVFKLTIKTAPLARWAVARAYRRKIWYRLKAEGIDISQPATQRMMVLNEQSDRPDSPMAAMVPQSTEPTLTTTATRSTDKPV